MRRTWGLALPTRSRSIDLASWVAGRRRRRVHLDTTGTGRLLLLLGIVADSPLLLRCHEDVGHADMLDVRLFNNGFFCVLNMWDSIKGTKALQAVPAGRHA